MKSKVEQMQRNGGEFGCPHPDASYLSLRQHPISTTICSDTATGTLRSISACSAA